MRGSIVKRLLVVSVSTIVFLLDQARVLFLRLIRRQTCSTAVVLLYHSIQASQREPFARQMDLLCRLANPVRADVRTPLDAGRRHVAVTFDDGLTSFADNAWPELEKRNIPAVVFVVAGKLGKVPDWANYTPGSLPTELTLSLDQLRRFPDAATIGSHSLTHKMLTDLGAAESRHEVQASRCQLESVTNRRVALFSFPYGENSKELIEQCSAAGYDRVFTNVPTLAFSEPEEFVTGRVDVQPTDWPIEFRLKVVGAYRWLPLAFVVKRFVVGLIREERVASSKVPEGQG